MNLLYVAIGGAAGSIARYLLSGAINQARAPMRRPAHSP